MMKQRSFSLSLAILLLFFAACQNPWGKLENPSDPKVAVQARLIQGAGSPSAGQGSNGDLYMDTANSTMYVKNSSAWSMVADLKGPTGPAGVTWLSGIGAPASSLGFDGDLYLDTAAIDVFTKTSGNWSKTVNLRGATGAVGSTGATGASGAAGLTGATGTIGAAGPTGATGPSGTTGSQGPIGATGVQGSQGLAGNTWYTGTATPPLASVGVDGDLYLNTATTQVYLKSSGA